MKSIKSNALKALVMITLFCPAAFADGDMGGGGFVDYDSPTKTARLPEGDMGGGGRPATPEFRAYLDSLMDSVCAYFDVIL